MDYKRKTRIPELELYTPRVLNSMSNRYMKFIQEEKLGLQNRDVEKNADGNLTFVERKLDFQQEKELTSDLPALIEHLNLTLCHGSHA